MKLHYNPISPYARKAMIFARIHGLDVLVVDAKADGIRGYTNGLNPLGKIPALELDDGRVLFDSVVICDYFDSLSNTPLLSDDRDTRFSQKTLHALGDGLSDAVYNYRYEIAREETLHCAPMLERHTTAMVMGISHLNDIIETLGTGWSYGNIAIICALDYMTYRAPHVDWAGLSPALAIWHSAFKSEAAYVDSYAYPMAK
ncbi:glutathione S-transferase family protein [Fretibacter rubidus]|uniref:glutathione S-transferase family protein n=1 Tax=Fretibacter rubidus TaxID=570162 RepID=UPI00352B4B67